MRCPGACLRETGKLTWKHLWPRVYSVFSERCLTGRDLTQKRWDIHIYDPLIMVMIKSTSMILVNVLVHFNQLLWYFCSFPQIQYRHPPSHLPSQKKISSFENKSRELQTFFVYSLFLLTNWNKEPDEERIYRWTEFFHKLDNKKWEIRTGARATKQNYISIYTSLYMKTFLKTGVYIYIYIYIYNSGPR